MFESGHVLVRLSPVLVNDLFDHGLPLFLPWQLASHGKGNWQSILVQLSNQDHPAFVVHVFHDKLSRDDIPFNRALSSHHCYKQCEHAPLVDNFAIGR